MVNERIVDSRAAGGGAATVASGDGGGGGEERSIDEQEGLQQICAGENPKRNPTRINPTQPNQMALLSSGVGTCAFQNGWN